MKRYLNDIIIEPIKIESWLPDRCLNSSVFFDPKTTGPESGCPSIHLGKEHSREMLEEIYRETITTYGGCGFIAWNKQKVVAYHNFFPSDMAQKIKFYGWGSALSSERTLIHNCLTITKGPFLRTGIATHLVNESLNWARIHDWERFQVNLVLPDCEKGWKLDQKSCLSFWKKFGFVIDQEHEADKETKSFYGAEKRYSLQLLL